MQRQRGIFRSTLLILKIPHRPPFPKWGNELPRSPEDFRDEVSTIENVCNSLSFRTCWSMTEYMIYFYPEAELRGIL